MNMMSGPALHLMAAPDLTWRKHVAGAPDAPTIKQPQSGSAAGYTMTHLKEKRSMKSLIFLAIVLLVILPVGCTPPPTSSSGSGITVTDPWARAAAAGNSAAYMTLRNGGSTADRLIRAESDAATTVELHQTTMEGGMMKMAPVDGIAVPAGGQVELKPGGLHVMLIGLKRELKAGEKLTLKLYFEKAGAQEIEAVVRQP